MSQAVLDAAKKTLSTLSAFVEELESGEHLDDSPLPPSSFNLLARMETLANGLFGPLYTLFTLAQTQFDLEALRFVIEFEVLESIDPNSGTDISEIAAAIGVDIDRTTRLLRMCTTRDIVKESKPGHFELTSMSTALLSDPEIKATIAFILDELHKGTASTTDYLKKYPFTKDSTETPFALAWGKPIYEWYDEHENRDRAIRFAKGQEGLAKLEQITGNAPLQKWIERHQKEGGKIVDLGGGRGHIAIELAKTFPDLYFEVQDKSQLMLGETTALEASARNRISFRQHDFFTEQHPSESPVLAYFFRHTLHNWADEETVSIISALVPALSANPTTTLLINEIIMPKPGALSRHQDRQVRSFDIAMMAVGNAKQRTEVEWRNLIGSVDKNLVVVSVVPPSGLGTLGLIEVRYSKGS